MNHISKQLRDYHKLPVIDVTALYEPEPIRVRDMLIGAILGAALFPGAYAILWTFKTLGEFFNG